MKFEKSLLSIFNIWTKINWLIATGARAIMMVAAMYTLKYHNIPHSEPVVGVLLAMWVLSPLVFKLRSMLLDDIIRKEMKTK